MYVAVGNDPYELLEIAYESISKEMGTFRTRKQKLRPPGIDTFGFCTWDAFYSSVDSDKVSAGLDSLADAGVTVKYVILDDGWQSTAVSGKNRKGNDKESEKGREETEVENQMIESINREGGNLESDTGSALLQSDLLLLDTGGLLNSPPIRTAPSLSSSLSSSSSLPSSSSVSLLSLSAQREDGSSLSSSSTLVAGDSLVMVGVDQGEDGELSGAQIDGNLAAQKMLEKESSPIVAFFTQVSRYSP